MSDEERPSPELELLVARYFEENERACPLAIEAYVERYPEHADALRDVLHGMELMEHAAEAFRAQDAVRQLDTLAVLGRARRRLAAGRSLLAGTVAPDRRPAGDFVTQILTDLEAHGSASKRYKPEGEIDRGGQGAVLAVWDETLRRHLAMKVTHSPADRRAPGTPHALSLGRFLEEAQVTAQLDHPGIVPVHDLGLDPERRVFFTMKLVKGRNLRTIFDLANRGEEKWNRTRALGVLLKVCEAMEYVHSKGVIHRDLKPSNVMVGHYGEVYVMDWGLARVLDGEDRKDIRIRPGTTSTIQSARHESSDDADSPLVTMDGDVVGTPAYMPPEQARGNIAAMGSHSDVYAIGAILYQLLTGQMPYVASDTRLSNRAVWALVQQGPPTPVHQLVPDVPAELQAICEKAMARDPRMRYPDTAQLAEDLRAYLEHRVVSAYETGAIAELRKWVGRNKKLAAACAAGIVLAIGGLAGVGYVQAEGKKTADVERAKVLRLSAFQELEDLERQADELWPPEPALIPAYETWLSRARALVAGLEPSADRSDIGHRAQIAELEARALPHTLEERERDRRSHPRFLGLSDLESRIAALRKAQDVREGKAEAESVVLDEDVLSYELALLNDMAWTLVNPDKMVPGELARGLALARRVVAGRATNASDRADYLDTLAWALLMNGLDGEARAASKEALETVPEERKEEFRRNSERLESKIKAATAALGALEEERAKLEEELVGRRTWSFSAESDRWWHAQLVKLIEELEALDDPATGLIAGISPTQGLGIKRRLEWAEQVMLTTVSGDAAAKAWAEAIALISDRDQCPQYGGLVIEPQLGLLPVTRNPRSGLWEFAYPLTGAIPEIRDGKVVTREEVGLVFVLLPGGSFTMGAQANDPSGPNYDPQAVRAESPPHDVTLSPFFMSKYEMTQGQWLRTTGRNPSRDNPEIWNPGWNRDHLPGDLLQPVEMVSWLDCVGVLDRLGLQLPTEAEWEYATRGGTNSVWWTGNQKEFLDGAANLYDRYAVEHGGHGWGRSEEEWLDDGNTTHAPVGSYLPNPFGLFDVHGNVWEWCRDAFDSTYYALGPRNDPWNKPSPSRPQFRVCRGGSHGELAAMARSSRRFCDNPDDFYPTLGLRPARSVTGEIRYAPDR